MPPRERYKPSAESKELTSRESLKGQFSKIISVHVDADNVDSFLEKALNQLILFTHAVTLAYQKELKKKDASITRQEEDSAFAHYSLPAIEEYFEGIEKRQGIVAGAQALINAIQAEEMVNTPPDRGKSIRTGNGHGTFENPATQKRLMLLLYLLKVDFDITLSQSDIQKGIVTRHMMRSESYITVSISEKDRVVYICGEIGNATYVFDTNKLSEINLSIEKLNLLTKDEKNALIAENPGIGIRTTYNKYYRETLTTLLENTIPSPEAFKEATKSKPELQKETFDAPQVITDELHPWRGFLERKNEEGVIEHFAGVSGIAQRLNVSTGKILLSLKGVSVLKGRDISGHENLLYSFEQIQEMLNDFLLLLQVDKEGEWEGFLKRENKGTGIIEHFGTIESVAEKLDIDESKIKASTKDLSVMEGRGKGGGKVNLYSLEQIKEKFKEFLALPQVVKEGEWEGFLEHINIDTGTVGHFGTVYSIASKLALTRKKIGDVLKGVSSLKGKNMLGSVANLYSLEEVKEKLKEFLVLPQVDKEGEWEGFLKRENKDGIIEHFGTAHTISQKLDSSSTVIASSLKGVSSLKGKNKIGAETVLYCLEQINEKLKDSFVRPQVDTEGDWKGFLEHINEVGMIEHYGAIEKIVQRLDISRKKLNLRVKALTPVKGKDVGGNKTDLYSLEQVIKKLADEKKEIT